MQNRTFKFYSDPSHGWVAVKRRHLVDLGLINTISVFSYQRGATVYLEEDCDARLFAESYKKKFGKYPIYKESHTNNVSPIRSYNNFMWCN